MKTDIEIAQEATMKPITEIAAQLGLADEDVIPYGRYKAKINHRLIHNAKKQGKLILVTAISPTPAGEGKTTTSVGHRNFRSLNPRLIFLPVMTILGTLAGCAVISLFQIGRAHV